MSNTDELQKNSVPTPPRAGGDVERLSAQDLHILLASLIQFGRSPDGSVERDLEAAIDRLTRERDAAVAERDELTATLKSVHAEYKLCRTRLMIVADEAVERERAAQPSAEPPVPVLRDWFWINAGCPLHGSPSDCGNG